eukprot:CAMPEP_0197025956 /NCGR_PEP_ID=MMETSP1384-20130603/6148_1 /TAXON_ID=29189 /ORGANISM="Ammonia sp." /LENGTH=357 /DNA_ID=CAMNT_0042454549 /DNA_START=31 /DNA_END=1104 /DNA_ORIENTATION=+
MSSSVLEEDIEELATEIEEFVKETEKINTDFRDTVSNINGEFRAVDAIFSKHHRQKKLYYELETQLKELSKEVAADETDSSQRAQPRLAELNESLSTIKLIVDNLGKSKRKTGSYFVSLIMGKVSVRIWNEGDRSKFKSEYNRFKERWMWMFFVLPALQMLLGFHMLINQLQSVLFFFYYSSLAMRENILALNGSRIESWWIYHHYWSMLISILSLLLYNEENYYELGIRFLNHFFVYQFLVMLLQNDYQKRRHYARKAMAKKSQLDIRTSEVIDETPHAKYKILIPALYITYFMQLLISLYFLFLSTHDSVKKSTLKCTQIVLMSLCWFILSIGNTSTLTRVLNNKTKMRNKRKSN